MQIWIVDKENILNNNLVIWGFARVSHKSLYVFITCVFYGCGRFRNSMKFQSDFDDEIQTIRILCVINNSGVV